MCACGKQMYAWAQDLFPINRSLIGQGVRDTLKYICGVHSDVKIFSVPSGKRAFGWEVPKEWTVRAAYVVGPDGNKVIDINDNNLHVVYYSCPTEGTVSFEELNGHLHSLPKLPDAIPYITSYYKEDWGFCLQHNRRQGLQPGNYQVVIDSFFSPGELNYAELILPGKEKKEVFFSTYVCHPSLANNETSGPVVMMALINYVKSIKNRRYTYRFVFAPERMGAIMYLKKNIRKLKGRVVAAFCVTCVGDNRCYSYLPSPSGITLADRAAKHALALTDSDYKKYSWLDRGSDEKQYCAPRINIPMCSIMRSKYAEYPEYHTSLDNLDFISPEGLFGAYSVICKSIDILENNYTYLCTATVEPKLGHLGLYETNGVFGAAQSTRMLCDIISLCDGSLDLLEVADGLGLSFFSVLGGALRLRDKGILKLHKKKRWLFL